VADGLLKAVAPWITVPAAPLPRNPRVLVIRLDHLGDAVMATSALPALAEALDPAALDVLCGSWARDVFASHPAVRDVLVADMPWWLAARRAPWGRRLRAWAALPGAVQRVRERRYDVVVELRGDLRQILCFAALSGAPTRVSTDRTGGEALLTRVWPFDQAPHEVEKTSQVIAQLGVRKLVRPQLAPPSTVRPALQEAWGAACQGRPAVVMALRGTEPNRTWPAGEAAALALQLERNGCSAILVGGAGDAAYARAVLEAGGPVADLTAKTTVSELAWVCRQAAVAVCVDSGPMHVAAAVGTPVVALFGPGDPSQSRPWGPTVDVLAERSPCGCVHPWCDQTHSRTAPGECMAAITAERIATAVMARIGAARPTGTSFS
jgi:ADP-heptose:LPS heptosyltransferase